MSLHTSDLVGLPYRVGGSTPAVGVDCLWVVREVAGRLFGDFDPLELPSGADEEAAAVAMAGSAAGRWMLVGSSAAAATGLGDVIHGHRADGGAWVAITIDRRGRLAITADAERGVHTAPVRCLQGVAHVLRRRA